MSVQGDYLQDIADAIREKDGSTDPIPAAEFAERVRGIPTVEDLHLVDDERVIAHQDSPGTVRFTFPSSSTATFLCLPMYDYDFSGTICACARKLSDGTWEAQSADSKGVSNFKKGLIAEGNDEIIWEVNPSGTFTQATMYVLLMA